MSEVYEEEDEESQAESEKKEATRAPKFLDKWLEIFNPWLTRSKNNINRPFCKACRTGLDCNRAHLQRHARTTKHKRNLKILVEHGEQAALDNFVLSRERNKYYFQRKMRLVNSNESIDMDNTADGEYVTGDDLENEGSFEYIKMDTTQHSDEQQQYEQKPLAKQEQTYKIEPPSKANIQRHKAIKKSPKAATAAVSRNERIKLFMQIQKDKNDLMKTFRDLISANIDPIVTATQLPTLLPAPQVPTPQMSQEKNHVDLFFESVSSTVKALSPKLIAEAKMRVQQLICELELRELTEGDKTSNFGNPPTTTIAAAAAVSSNSDNM